MKLSKELQEFLKGCEDKWNGNEFGFHVGQPVSGVSRALKLLGEEKLLNELKKLHRKNEIKLFVDDEWLHIQIIKP